jgi:alcohol dehydrogenase
VARSIGGFFSAALLGAMIGGRRRMGVFMWVPNHEGDMARIGELIASGAVDPVIDRVFSLAETPQAMAHQESGNARGKVVLAVAS